MISEQPLFEVKDLDDVVVVIPTRDMGEFEMADVKVPPYQQLTELTDGRGVVIDFSRTDYFGSSTIGLFIQFAKHVHANGFAIAFCNLSNHERQVVKVAHINELWDVLETQEQAIEFVRVSQSKATATE